MRATCWFLVVTTRSLRVVHGRDPRSPPAVPMPAAASSGRSRFAFPVVADEPGDLDPTAQRGEVVGDVGGAAEAIASWVECTTGTGASGEIRRRGRSGNGRASGRPPRAPRVRRTIDRGRGQLVGAASTEEGPRGGEGRGPPRKAASPGQEKHQELGVAEIVFEQSGRQHRPAIARPLLESEGEIGAPRRQKSCIRTR